MVLVRCFFIILFAVFLGSCERLKTSVIIPDRDPQVNEPKQSDYLAIYQIPVHSPCSFQNIIEYFKFSSTTPNEKHILLGCDLSVLSNLDISPCSKRQVELLEKYIFKKNKPSEPFRFFDFTKALHSLIPLENKLWAVYDTQESQLYLYASPQIHSYLENHQIRHIFYPDNLDIQLTVFSQNSHQPASPENQTIHNDICLSIYPGMRGSFEHNTEKGDTLTFQVEPNTTAGNTPVITTDYEIHYKENDFQCDFKVAFTSKNEQTHQLAAGVSTKSKRQYFAKIHSRLYRPKAFLKSYHCSLPYDTKPNTSISRSLLIDLNKLPESLSSEHSDLVTSLLTKEKDKLPAYIKKAHKINDTLELSLTPIAYEMLTSCPLHKVKPGGYIQYKIYKLQKNSIKPNDIHAFEKLQPLFEVNQNLKDIDTAEELKNTDCELEYNSSISLGEKAFYPLLFQELKINLTLENSRCSFSSQAYLHDKPQVMKFLSHEGYDYYTHAKVIWTSRSLRKPYLLNK